MDRSLAMMFILAAGLAQPVQAVVNGQLAKLVGTPVWASCISAAITSVTLAILGVTVFRVTAPSGPPMPVQAPFFAVAGGVIGALVLGAMTAVTPRLGAVVTFLCFVAGITVCSVVLDHLGVLGLPQRSLSAARALGVVLIVGGVAIVRIF